MWEDINVRQYDSSTDQDDGRGKIYAHLRASNTKILLVTALNAIPHLEDSTLEANIYLELYGQERERTLRWGCVEADVSIMFPWNMPRFESLKAQHRNTGDVDVWFANKRIEIESKLHTTLSLISSNASDLDLMVSAETVAQVSMQSPFYSHVALTTWASFFRPEVFFTPRDTFVQQTKTLQTLTGYFPYANGTEPESPFPRVTVNGEQASFALTSPSLPSFLHSRTGRARLKIAQTNK
ncbi:hypothetical protein K457DRAFT_126610 [Linnemannia elongata AG-77]|uniref:Uncharacterized protein n=1 Tax=Linnemannia elongata AG-77 TaxID=1314771 RepID=A0A197JWA8_9FUNG|nr:hypothetical protein K457DRAFT_126610 [Linnemannia elongata AG-77]